MARRRARTIPEEVAVALTYNRFSYAVMMASPSDLEDFAVGFSLPKRVVAAPREIEDLEIVHGELGIELRMWIAAARAAEFTERRRYLAGPTGCGLCGVETLAEAMPQSPQVGSDAADLGRKMIAARSTPCRSGRSIIARPMRSMPRRSGSRGQGSSRCARMSAGTMRSTSSSGRWRGTGGRPRKAPSC